MNAALVIGIGVGVFGLVALAGGSSAKKSKSVELHKSVRGFPVDYKRLLSAMAGKEGPGSQDIARAMWNDMQAKFLDRRVVLPKDAYPTQDKYTKEHWILPSVNPFGMSTFGEVDEFGRVPAGLPQNFGATLLKVTQTVAPLIPGIGPAAGAALAYAIAIGQGKSQKDAILAAARGALPIQYQMAFDLGVGVASGQPVSEAAKKAIFAYYPGSQTAYDQGRTLYKKVGG